MTSTSSSVSRTRSLRRWPSSVRGLCSPGVSTRTSWAPGLVAMPRMVCRVVCGLDDVMATFWPTRALVRVDLPAFGRPTRQANPARYAGASPSDEVSCDSSLMGLLLLEDPAGERLGVGGVQRFQPAHDHRGDPVPSTGHLLRRQGQPRDGGGRPRDRHPADGRGEEAADGVDLLLLDVDVEEVAQVV